MIIVFGRKAALVKTPQAPYVIGGTALAAAPYSTGINFRRAADMLTLLSLRQVIKNVRELLAPSKTISLTSRHGFGDSLDGTVISSTHPYLDYITITTWGRGMEAYLAELELFGIPFNKVFKAIRSYL